MELWRKNLYVIFIAQFFVIMGFNFVNPFLPLYIQELGGYSNSESAFWAGMSQAGLGIALFTSGPIWGIIADRWGRKSMVLRAQFLSAFILLGLGFAPNVYWVIVFRVLQGFFSGTMTAAQAMVAADTPREKLPFAMGFLLAAVFMGTTVGPLVGGVLADALGYRITFYITAALLFTGGLLVLFFTRENFTRPEAGQGASLKSLWSLATSRQMLPLLMTLFALQLGPQMIQPIIPILLKEINPDVMAATMSGVTFGLMGVTAAISSAFAARIGGRISLKKILIVSCVGTGLLYLPPVWAGTIIWVIVFITLSGFFKGGLMASSSALVGLTSTKGEQGVAYGVAQSANALGIAIGPLLGGLLAPMIGLRAVFGVGAGVFIVIGAAVARFLSDVSLKKAE